MRFEVYLYVIWEEGLMKIDGICCSCWVW